ncbi:hypothetical protein R6Q57_020219 [Mikania cordata]
MRSHHFHNHYINLEDNDQFHDYQLNHSTNHHHHPCNDSGSMTYEGSSNNGGIFSGFDQIADRSFHLHPQGGSPIGLTLRKSNSLINLVEMTLSHQREQKKVESQSTPEKLKASNFPALLLQIGNWKRISRNEGDLVAKIYYAKKKLVWEFLDGPLKNKLEIQWSEISAIRSFVHQGEHDRLEIELNQPPLFSREINPQPRRHTQWKQTMDFTGGQASICRRHLVIFPPGVLEKQYEKLLQCDNRLFNLSQQPFPVDNYPFFYHDPNHCLDYSHMNVRHQSPPHFHGDVDSNFLTPVMSFPCSNEGARWHTPKNQERGNNHFEGIYATHIRLQDQQSQTELLQKDINSTGYKNGGISSIDELDVNSRFGIQEHNSWIDVPNLYDLSWEPGMETFEDLYRNHQYSPNY